MNSAPLAATNRWQPLVANALAVRRLARELGVEPMLAAILVNRGHSEPDAAREFLAPSVDRLHDPLALADMDRASERLARSVRDGERVLIYGDADVDGLSGTALLVDVLTLLGSRPDVFVPNRAYEGYSFTDKGVAHVLERRASVVVSVDNGATAGQPVADLQAAGVDVIITDHHLPGDVLPPAFAVVNPRREDCRYPFAGLSGAGVAFKLACALAGKLAGHGKVPSSTSQVLGEALAWVALGTVADMMPLDDENRVLVARGLVALPRSRSPGLSALCAVAGLGPGSSATAEDISFRLAPRLNAASRMGRSELSVQLVTCADPNHAAALAAQLDGLNRERQAAERRLVTELEPRLGDVPDDEPAICWSDDWNTGLMGLVAGRVARQRGLPAVLVSWANGEPGKGSSRSPGGFDLHAALAACGEHLESHGGHANAAGFSIRREHMEPFRQAFLAHWRAARSDRDTAPPLLVEAELPLVALEPRFVHALERLQPYGQGNLRPLLGCWGVELALARRMGGDGTHLELQLAQGPARVRGVAFGRGHLADVLRPGTTLDLVIHAKLNRWRGREQVEAEIVDLRTSPGASRLDAAASA